LPSVDPALLNCLRDDEDAVLAAAARAQAGRDTPEITAALLDRLADDHYEVRYAAQRALSDAQSPWALVIAARAIPALPLSCWPTLTEVAEQLMPRHYLRLEPAERAAVRLATAQLFSGKDLGGNNL
jgi:hypothetical protein